MSQTFVFNDPFFQREEIFKLTKNIPGCYIWLNKINSKCYVGSSLNLAKRLYFYYGYKTVKINFTSLIINALLSHGMNNFSLIIITLPKKEKESILNLEQFLLSYYNSEYNILKIAGSTTGKELSKAHKTKISESRKTLLYSNESKALMSKTQFHLNNSGINNIKGNGFINVYSIDKILLNQYVSAREAAKSLNTTGVTIGKYARTGQLFKNLYYFSFDLIDASFINKINIQASTNNTTNLSKLVKVFVYNSNRNKIHEFNSLAETGRKLEISVANISNYLNTHKVYKELYLFYSYEINEK